MIYHDDKSRFGDGLAFLQAHRQLIGEVESITMADSSNLAYPFKVVGEMGEIWLSSWANVPAIMRELGYPEEAVDAARKNAEFRFGPPRGWKLKPARDHYTPSRVSQDMLDSAEEVLTFLETYHEENESMPTGPEIMAGCDSVATISMAHDRLRLLQQQGRIHRHYRRHRGIVLL